MKLRRSFIRGIISVSAFLNLAVGCIETNADRIRHLEDVQASLKDQNQELLSATKRCEDERDRERQRQYEIERKAKEFRSILRQLIIANRYAASIEIEPGVAADSMLVQVTTDIVTTATFAYAEENHINGNALQDLLKQAMGEFRNDGIRIFLFYAAAPPNGRISIDSASMTLSTDSQKTERVLRYTPGMGVPQNAVSGYICFRDIVLQEDLSFTVFLSGEGSYYAERCGKRFMRHWCKEGWQSEQWRIPYKFSTASVPLIEIVNNEIILRPHQPATTTIVSATSPSVESHVMEAMINSVVSIVARFVLRR